MHRVSTINVKVPCATMSVPKAGEVYLGLSSNGSYAAAHRGDIPTIRVGRLLRVPIRAMEAKLEAVSGNEPAPSRSKTGESERDDLRRVL